MLPTYVGSPNVAHHFWDHTTANQHVNCCSKNVFYAMSNGKIRKGSLERVAAVSSCISVYIWFARRGKPQHITVELPDSYAVTQGPFPGLFLDSVQQGWIATFMKSRLDLSKCIGNALTLEERQSTCFGSYTLLHVFGFHALWYSKISIERRKIRRRLHLP